MILYDFECEKCGNIEEQMVSSDIKEISCAKCKGKSTRLFPNKMRFKLLYDPRKDKVAWGNESYNTTRRYEMVNKEAAKLREKRNIIDVGANSNKK